MTFDTSVKFKTCVDVRVCSSWMYQVDQLFFHLPPKVDTALFRPNGVWALVDSSTVYRVEDQYATARFVIYLSRKPEYFTYTLIYPCVMLSMLMFLVYLLPPESGEKISLQITVLLSFTVFQLIVTSSMPQTSDFVPIIGKCCFRCTSVVLLSTFRLQVCFSVNYEFVFGRRRGSVFRTSVLGWRTFPDLWLTGDHFVGKVSAMGQPTRLNQPFVSPGSVNE